MKWRINVITVLVLLVGLGSLVYALALARYNVYSTTTITLPPVAGPSLYTPPLPNATITLPSVTVMSQAQLMAEMCYDGIARDEKGNLITKAKNAACST